MSIFDEDYRRCAFCKEMEAVYTSQTTSRALFKYSTRRYTHASCGVKRMGERDLRNKLPEFQARELTDRLERILKPGGGK